MSALEIVLTCVIGFCIVLAIVILLVERGLRINKAQSYRILNSHAKKGHIVFFGDSLTDFFPIQEFFDEPTIYNRGIASDTTSHLLQRMDNVIDLEPSKLFLLIGTNDLGMGETPEQTIVQIEKIIDQILTANPQTKVYVSSQYPMKRNLNFYSFFLCGTRSTKKLLKLNELEKEMCQKKELTYIDMWEVLADYEGRLQKVYTLDGLHLTTTGYSVVADKLSKYIIE